MKIARYLTVSTNGTGALFYIREKRDKIPSKDSSLTFTKWNSLITTYTGWAIKTDCFFHNL